MSLNPSLRIDSAGAQQRTVLTRIERIKDLMKKDLWHDAHAVTGLPKTKIVRIKTAKKEKKEEAAAEGAAATAETAQAPAADAKAAKAK
jgi:small basic protein (TIGR04137 family)